MLNCRLLRTVALGLLHIGVASFAFAPVHASDTTTDLSAVAENEVVERVSVWSFVGPVLQGRASEGRLFRLGPGGALVDLDVEPCDPLRSYSVRPDVHPEIPSAPYRLGAYRSGSPQRVFVQ